MLEMVAPTPAQAEAHAQMSQSARRAAPRLVTTEEGYGTLHFRPPAHRKAPTSLEGNYSREVALLAHKTAEAARDKAAKANERIEELLSHFQLSLGMGGLDEGESEVAAALESQAMRAKSPYGQPHRSAPSTPRGQRGNTTTYRAMSYYTPHEQGHFSAAVPGLKVSQDGRWPWTAEAQPGPRKQHRPPPPPPPKVQPPDGHYGGHVTGGALTARSPRTRVHLKQPTNSMRQPSEFLPQQPQAAACSGSTPSAVAEGGGSSAAEVELAIRASKDAEADMRKQLEQAIKTSQQAVEEAEAAKAEAARCKVELEEAAKQWKIQINKASVNEVRLALQLYALSERCNATDCCCTLCVCATGEVATAVSRCECAAHEGKDGI